MNDEDGRYPRDEPRSQLARLVSLLVDSPRAAHVEERRQRSSTVFVARVAAADLGKLIGRQGRTARAVRALLDVRGEGDGRRYGFEIRES
jgi:predicted RNA-binding protein YlqC (UPF0109 family)